MWQGKGRASETAWDLCVEVTDPRSVQVQKGGDLGKHAFHSPAVVQSWYRGGFWAKAAQVFMNSSEISGNSGNGANFLIWKIRTMISSAKRMPWAVSVGSDSDTTARYLKKIT